MIAKFITILQDILNRNKHDRDSIFIMVQGQMKMCQSKADTWHSIWW